MIGRHAHLKDRVLVEQVRAFPRIQDMDESLEILLRDLPHAIAIERYNLGGKQWNVRPADVLEDRIGEVEDGQFAIGGHPVDLGLEKANNLWRTLGALGQHGQRVDRVFGGIVHHRVDLSVELTEQRLDLRLGTGRGR